MKKSVYYISYIRPSMSFSSFFLTGDNFSLTVPVLYGLQIPELLKNSSAYDTVCQNQHFTDLTGFYQSTNGKNWAKQKHWGDRTKFYCSDSYKGILCYRRTLHVVAIKLQENKGMREYVGATLGNLPFLLGVSFKGSELLDNVAELLATFKPFFIRFNFAYNLSVFLF